MMKLIVSMVTVALWSGKGDDDSSDTVDGDGDSDSEGNK